MHAFAVLVLLASPPPPSEGVLEPGATLLVLDLTAGAEIRPDLLRALSDQLAVQVRQRNPTARVLGMTEVRSMLELATTRQKLGCQQDLSCIAEIGGALGAREVVNGSLARIGSHEVLTLRRVSARSVKVLVDATAEVAVGNEDALLSALRSSVRKLFPLPTAAETALTESTSADAPHSHVASAVLFAGAGLGAAAAVTGGVLLATSNLSALRSDSLVASTAPTASSVIGARNQQELGTGLAIGGAIAAVVLGTSGILLW